MNVPVRPFSFIDRETGALYRPNFFFIGSNSRERSTLKLTVESLGGCTAKQLNGSVDFLVIPDSIDNAGLLTETLTANQQAIVRKNRVVCIRQKYIYDCHQLQMRLKTAGYRVYLDPSDAENDDDNSDFGDEPVANGAGGQDAETTEEDDSTTIDNNNDDPMEIEPNGGDENHRTVEPAAAAPVSVTQQRTHYLLPHTPGLGFNQSNSVSPEAEQLQRTFCLATTATTVTNTQPVVPVTTTTTTTTTATVTNTPHNSPTKTSTHASLTAPASPTSFYRAVREFSTLQHERRQLDSPVLFSPPTPLPVAQQGFAVFSSSIAQTVQSHQPQQSQQPHLQPQPAEVPQRQRKRHVDVPMPNSNSLVAQRSGGEVPVLRRPMASRLNTSSNTLSGDSEDDRVAAIMAFSLAQPRTPQPPVIVAPRAVLAAKKK